LLLLLFVVCCFCLFGILAIYHQVVVVVGVELGSDEVVVGASVIEVVKWR
jgi:hypothetical protein